MVVIHVLFLMVNFHLTFFTCPPVINILNLHLSAVVLFLPLAEGFTSVATLTNLTSKKATVSWQAGPGDISHYRLEVRSLRGDWADRTWILTNLTYDVDQLIEGSGYSVQVFPVKCGRDLPSNKVIFHTSESILNCADIII